MRDINLSELCACGDSSKLYQYMDTFVVVTSDNRLLAAIISDCGFEPLLRYRDCLINELHFTLENEYGLTNMVGDYTYQGNSFILEYDMDCDTIYFSVDIKNETIPSCFFETISYLEKIDVKKSKG